MARFILALACLVIGARGQERTANEQRLMEDLFARSQYNKNVRPQLTKDQALRVDLTYSLIAVNEINAGKGYVDLTAYLGQGWKDARLAWTPADYGGIEDIRVPMALIWTPDIQLFNAIPPGTTVLTQQPLAIVRHTGDVYLMNSVGTRSPCDARTYLQSGNKVNCTLRFGSWTYNNDQLDVSKGKKDKVNLSDFIFSGKWQPTKTWVRREFKTYPCCEEAYSNVEMGFEFEPKKMPAKGKGGARRGRGKPGKRNNRLNRG